MLDIFFPKNCKICNCRIREEKKKFICSVCWQCIEKIKEPFCSICGEPFFSKEKFPKGYRCGRCRKKNPFFDKAISFVIYSGVIKELIHLYKYKSQIGIIDDLFSLVEESFEGMSGFHSDLLIHIPLNKHNLKKRGFDQSYILAKKISRCFNIPLVYNSLIRKKKTKAQVGLNIKGRKKNIRGAFIIKNSKILRGKNILLIDDVMTTGATANECSKMLKSVGVKSVSVLTLARTIF